MPKDEQERSSQSASGGGKEAPARTIDLEKDEVKGKKTAKDEKDATQPKSKATEPPSRLKAPPKAAPETAKKAEASSSGQSSSAPKAGAGAKEKVDSRPGLLDEALTKVAQEKFEAQEDKLAVVAKHAMASLRDFHKLSEADYPKKVIEIRKALMKYEMQYVRVWELQDRTRQAEIADSQATCERHQAQALAEREIIGELSIQLEKEKQRKRRYEQHEATAATVNLKRTRKDLEADIETKTKEIEQLRRQNSELKEQAEQIQQRAQLLREAAVDVKQLLAEQMASPAGIAPQASPRKSGNQVEVIS
jgi:hypothetical protein